MFIYQIKRPPDGINGNITARVFDVEESVFDSRFNELLCNLRFILTGVGDVNDGELCNLGHDVKCESGKR